MGFQWEVVSKAVLGDYMDLEVVSKAVLGDYMDPEVVFKAVLGDYMDLQVVFMEVQVLFMEVRVVFMEAQADLEVLPRRLRRQRMASSRTCSGPGVLHGSLAGARLVEADLPTTVTSRRTTMARRRAPSSRRGWRRCSCASRRATSPRCPGLRPASEHPPSTSGC